MAVGYFRTLLGAGIVGCCCATVLADAGDAVKPEPVAVTAAQARAAGLLGLGGPTDAEVGDADSFGRTVRWLGLAQTGAVVISADCTAPSVPPEARCHEPVGDLVDFDERDLGRIELPARSATSLICHDLTQILTYRYANPGSVPAQGLLNLRPYLTLESEVLDDPTLIDPVTGLPFGGAMELSFAATHVDSVGLEPGASLLQRDNFTRSCIGGLLSKRHLTEGYGLSDATANAVFRHPITLRLHLAGQTRAVADATLFYGLRLTGD